MFILVKNPTQSIYLKSYASHNKWGETGWSIGQKAENFPDC